jgi:glycosyltransferase involved in cell wall biosynthesis
VTYNPVTTDDLPRLAAEPLDHPWVAPGAPPIVLGAGKLKPQKAFDVLLRAFSHMRARRPARLVILGEGPERSRLEALARKLGVAGDVALPGFAANPFAWMSRCGVFALSSAWEGLPGVLIQALACGCPVVSTDCPSGPSEILEPGGLGRLVAVGDTEALAAAIEEALTEPPSTAEARRDRAREFSVERIAPRYLAALFADATPATSSASRSATAA